MLYFIPTGAVGLSFTGSTGPTGPTGAIGATGPNNVTNVMLLPSTTTAGQTTSVASAFNLILQRFTAPSVGSGDILASGGNTMTLPAMGTYLLSFSINYTLGCRPPEGYPCQAQLTAAFRQTNTGATFNQLVGSRTGNIMPVPGNNFYQTISNTVLACVSDTDGGNLNNIFRVKLEYGNFSIPVITLVIRLFQTTVTVVKYPDQVCS